MPRPRTPLRQCLSLAKFLVKNEVVVNYLVNL